MRRLADTELIRLVDDRLSEDAADELFGRYLPKLRTFIARKGIVDRDVVDDLVQETMVRAVGRLASFDRSRPFSSWIFGIAANCCREWFARHKRGSALFYDERDQESAYDPPGSLFDTLESYFGDPCILVIRKLETEALQDAIAQLTEEQQRVVEMRFFGGASLKETASALGKSVEAVESAQVRALRALYRILHAEQTEDYLIDQVPNER